MSAPVFDAARLGPVVDMTPGLAAASLAAVDEVAAALDASTAAQESDGLDVLVDDEVLVCRPPGARRLSTYGSEDAIIIMLDRPDGTVHLCVCTDLMTGLRHPGPVDAPDAFGRPQGVIAQTRAIVSLARAAFEASSTQGATAPPAPDAQTLQDRADLALALDGVARVVVAHRIGPDAQAPVVPDGIEGLEADDPLTAFAAAPALGTWISPDERFGPTLSVDRIIHSASGRDLTAPEILRLVAADAARRAGR